MEIGKTEKYFNDLRAEGKGVFMALIDPDKQGPEKAAEMAKMMEDGGADVIMLGGSIGAQGPAMDNTAKLIKEKVKIPLHIFPGNISSVTQYSDSIYFMSLMNSKNPYWITGAQVLSISTLKKHGIEAIPTAYLVFEPGETVGWVGEARLIPRKKPDIAVAYAMAAETLGMRFVILESGSGAHSPVPVEIVQAIRKHTKLRIIVAGGVKTPEQAAELIKAGADGIHIGTKIEEANDPMKRIRAFADAIHGK